MFSFEFAEYNDIVEADYNWFPNERVEDKIHLSYKGWGRAGHTKVLCFAFLGSILSSEHCLGDIYIGYAHLIVSSFQVNIWKYLGTSELI